MANLKDITKKDLEQAAKKIDADEAKMREKYGARKATKYRVRLGGQEYDSKLLVAVAIDEHVSGFSGGKARLGPVFKKAGVVLGALAFLATAPAIVEGAQDKHRDRAASDASVDAVYFASGSNNPAQIRGFSSIGQAVGVAAAKLNKRTMRWSAQLSENAENALHSLSGTGLPVFVDSGAFSEVDAALRVVAPMPEEIRQRTMDLYARLSLTLGAQLHVVAMDRVGDQDATLAMVRRWAPELRALISNGANVLVVAQLGKLSQADFDREVERILGTDKYARALPCNKGATSTQAIGEFCRERQPKRLHLLGLGLRNDRTPDVSRAIAKASPRTLVSLDSCLLTESVGKKNGRDSHSHETKGGPRVFTAARNMARKLKDAGKAALKEVEELAIELAWGTQRTLV